MRALAPSSLPFLASDPSCKRQGALAVMSRSMKLTARGKLTASTPTMTNVIPGPNVLGPPPPPIAVSHKSIKPRMTPISPTNSTTVTMPTIIDLSAVARAEGQANFLETSMTGAAAFGPDGDELLLAKNVTCGFSIDEGISAGLQSLAETDPEQVVPNIVQLLADGNFGFHYTASGLRIPLGEMLSNSQRHRIGSNGSEVVTGTAAMSLSSKADRIRLVADTDLEGMQDAHLDLEMVITPGRAGAPQWP